MSRRPKNNYKDTGNVAGGNRPPKYNWDEYFRFRPIPFAQFLLAEIEGYKNDKQKRDYYTALLRLACSAIISNLPFVCVAIVAIAISGYLLFNVGFFDSNRVIAVFTVVLAIVAIAQWRTYRRQWRVMQTQNEIMARQAGQSEIVINTMRLGQRAWLCTDSPNIISRTAEKWRLEIPVHNSGNLPGRIIGVTILSTLRSNMVSNRDLTKEFEQLGVADEQTFDVSPREKTTVRIDDLELYDGAIDALKSKSMMAHVLCRFWYTDALETSDEAKALYTYDIDSGGFVLQGDYDR